jgi:hypothetical protein
LTASARMNAPKLSGVFSSNDSMPSAV